MTPGFVIMHQSCDLWKMRCGQVAWFAKSWHVELYWHNAKARVDDHELWDIVAYDLDMIDDRTEFLDKITEKQMRRMEGGR